MKVKEITANKAYQIATHETVNAEKEMIMNEISKCANEGRLVAIVPYHRDVYYEITEWLSNLGYSTVVSCDCSKLYIHWASTNEIRKRQAQKAIAHSKIQIMTEPAIATVKGFGPTPAGVSYGWLPDKDKPEYICSRCDERSYYTSNYCPHCGAKMHIIK